MAINDLFKKKSEPSVYLAKDRLKLVLISDRAKCSPEIISQIKNDIVNVISKYVEININDLDIKIVHKDLKSSLQANIPISDFKK
jgi:cell division topological specificity factor